MQDLAHRYTYRHLCHLRPPHPGLPTPGTDVKLVSPEGCCSDRGLSEPSEHLLWKRWGHPVLSLETIMEAVWGMQGDDGKQLQGSGN